MKPKCPALLHHELPREYKFLVSTSGLTEPDLEVLTLRDLTGLPHDNEASP